MSQIAGVLHLDGRPASPALLNQIAEPSDTERTFPWSDGPAAFVNGNRYSVRDFGDLCIAFDGRIDNRDELRRALPEPMDDGDSDIQFIASAYRRWGNACAQRIIGDFAFCVWDRKNRQLLCARDPIGVRPFFYSIDRHKLVFATEIRRVLRSGIRREPNESVIAEYLAGSINNPAQTFYNGIHRLLPGHSLIARDGSIVIRRHFEPNSAATIRYSSDAQYTEHFLHLFREAVRCRMRSQRKVGVYLSGGVDSSSVAVISRQLQAERGDKGLFNTFSMIFPQMACDESRYIEHVGRLPGIKCNTAAWTRLAVSDYREHVHRFQDLPDYPNGAMSQGTAALAKRMGFDVLLTGLGGDEWFMGSPYHYADLLRSMKLMEFVRQVRAHQSIPENNLSLRALARFGLMPLLPERVQRLLGRVARPANIPDWIDSGFARRTNLNERLRFTPLTAKPTLAQSDIYSVLTCGMRMHALEMEARSADDSGVEQRHPLLDRRILEFALALPEEQRWRRHETKFVLRHAMKSKLPEEIRQRRTKAEFSPVFFSTFESNGGSRLFDSMSIARRGWVNPVAVQEKYLKMANAFKAGDLSYIRHASPLWMIFGVNLWYSTVFENQN